MGIRLRPVTEKLPKGLIKIEGKTLLEYSFSTLKENGMKEVIIVVGFLGEAIKQKFGREYRGLRITYVTNEEYSKTGSMYSFSKAKDTIRNDGIILLESDLLYEPKAIKLLLDSNYKDCILVAKLSGSGDEVYICVDDNQRIIELGKNISAESKRNAIGELVGISRFSKEFLCKLFKKAAEEYKKGKLDYEYEECMFITSKLGNPVHAIQCKNLSWTEIDNENDLKRAKEKVYPKIKRIIYKVNSQRNILLNQK